MELRLLVIVLVSFFNTCTPYRYNVSVGAIFGDLTDENEEIAFQVALDIVNKQRRLPYNLVPVTGRIEADEVFDAKHGFTIDYTWDKPFGCLELTCSILRNGVVGLFNPLYEHNSNAIQSVCDAKGIPVIKTGLDIEHGQECCKFNVYPHVQELATAFAEVVVKWDWKNFTIIYEDQESLRKITEMLKIYNSTGHSVIVRQLYTTEPMNFRTALKDIWKTSQTNFVLDCSTENLPEILKQAQQIGLMTNEFSYIIINLDLHTIDLAPYQYSETNITSFRFIDPTNKKIIELARAIQVKKQQLGYPLRLDSSRMNPYLGAWKIQSTTALMVDAVMLFAKVLEKMGHLDVKPIYCNSTSSWLHGETIFNYLKAETYDGLTGFIQFDQLGFRSDFGLHLIELKEGGITKIGTWNRREGLNISRIIPVVEDSDPDSLKNKSFTVVIVKTEPYAMLKDTRVKLTGNDQYEGFAIDLIKYLAELEGFNYTFMVSSGNGDYNSTTKLWTGMMGDVLSKKADLAIADLTITRLRQQYVDFTNPFMALGILILYATPTPAPPGFFSFASPFHLEVWGLLTISYFGVSLAMFIMARLCPSEWTNPFPCIEEPEYLINQFNLRNSLWFNLGGLMQQGSDIAPVGLPTRLLAGIWWYFTLIMVSSYTANLAAFLTTQVPNWDFTNVNELVERADKMGIKYGALKGGSTFRFFKDSENENYAKIGKFMIDNMAEVMVTKNSIGVKMAEQGNYAFFMESSSVEYAVKGSCNLTTVGHNLDEKSYGIAMRKEMPYRSRLSAAVLKLKEKGIIDDLKRKWWEQNRKKPECEGEEDESDAPPLSLKNVGGIFWVSIGGAVIGFGLVFTELALHTIKKYGRDGTSCMEEFKDEIKFYFAFKGMVKEVKNRKGDTDSNESKENFELEKTPNSQYGFVPQILTED